MMSLARTSLLENSKKQFQFKLKSYMWAFSTLVILQLLGVLFSIGGTGSIGSGRNEMFIQIQYYSADIVIGFTMLWAFIVGTQITATIYKENEFMFVTNKLSHLLSDGAFLIVTSVMSGILALLSGFLIKVLAYLFLDFTPNVNAGITLDLKHVIFGLIATILCVALSGSLGYTVGMLVQLNKLFIVILPTVFFGLIYVSARYDLYDKNFMYQLFNFYFQESNIFLFIMKVVITIIGLFLASILISKQLEVRR